MHADVFLPTAVGCQILAHDESPCDKGFSSRRSGASGGNPRGKLSPAAALAAERSGSFDGA